MKRYVRSNVISHFKYDNIYDWYLNEEGGEDNDRFAQKLESLVKTNFDVSYYFEEPSIQQLLGSDFVDIELSDGHKYSFEFNWRALQEAIFEYGPEAAAGCYFNKIKKGIESGSASTDTLTL